MYIRVSNLRLILVSTLPTVVPLILLLVYSAMNVLAVSEASSRGYICIKPTGTTVKCIDVESPRGKYVSSSTLPLVISVLVAVVNTIYTLGLSRFYRSIEVSRDKVVVHTLARTYSMDRSRVRAGKRLVPYTVPLLLGPTWAVTIAGEDTVLEAILHSRDAELILQALSSNDRYEGAPMDQDVGEAS